ncbi:MAG: DUF2442 domain-containing protein [Clostridia bacterium]|nr:DUF2442 domain-containing protein [Clostridia bacterium]
MALNMTYFWPRVLQAVPTDEYQVYAYFNDGSVRLFDVKPLIKPGTVFAPLENLSFFKNKLTVINHTVAWDVGGNRDPSACVDLDPLVLFQQPIVADPLEKEMET